MSLLGGGENLGFVEAADSITGSGVGPGLEGCAQDSSAVSSSGSGDSTFYASGSQLDSPQTGWTGDSVNVSANAGVEDSRRVVQTDSSEWRAEEGDAYKEPDSGGYEPDRPPSTGGDSSTLKTPEARLQAEPTITEPTVDTQPPDQGTEDVGSGLKKETGVAELAVKAGEFADGLTGLDKIKQGVMAAVFAATMSGDPLPANVTVVSNPPVQIEEVDLGETAATILQEESQRRSKKAMDEALLGRLAYDNATSEICDPKPGK